MRSETILVSHPHSLDSRAAKTRHARRRDQDETHLSRPTVSHHLKILKESQIISVRKEEELSTITALTPVAS